MIENATYGFHISCDSCSNYYDYDEDYDWKSMIKEIKSFGWKIWKTKKDVWLHHCPVCAEKHFVPKKEKI